MVISDVEIGKVSTANASAVFLQTNMQYWFSFGTGHILCISFKDLDIGLQRSSGWAREQFFNLIVMMIEADHRPAHPVNVIQTSVCVFYVL